MLPLPINFFCTLGNYVYSVLDTAAALVRKLLTSDCLCIPPGRIRTRRQSSGSATSITSTPADTRGRSRAKVVSQSQRKNCLVLFLRAEQRVINVFFLNWTIREVGSLWTHNKMDPHLASVCSCWQTGPQIRVLSCGLFLPVVQQNFMSLWCVAPNNWHCVLLRHPLCL